MVDLSWLSSQAKSIHDTFVHIFYGLATVLLMIGVVIEYFKFPLGGSTLLPQLVARTVIAAILLHSYPEISNTIADITDGLAKQLGDLNQLKTVLDGFDQKLNHMSGMWTSIKDSLIMLVSFLLFFILYVSVYLADAGVIFGWTLLYIFSPLLIVMYILPATAQITSTLYRSLFEISAWKIVWSVLATLLWSFALGTINKPESEVNFITVLALNLILAASILFTPQVVHALVSKGISGIASQMSGVSTAASLLNPGARVAGVARWADNTFGSGLVKNFASQKAGALKERFFPSKAAGHTKVTNAAKSASNVQKVKSNPQKMPEPPQWVKQALPNFSEPPHWIAKQLEKEKPKNPSKS